MRFKELFEARIINGPLDEPLRDNETIRVYHGAREIETIIMALTYGLSGDTRANRAYSYEFNNNPKGLFVTPSLKVAKEFGQHIIELHVKVSDLESPVWPGGSFTGQGGYSKNFNDDDEREEERQRKRSEASKSNDENIANSDRPELAEIISSSYEPQALFTGNLNRNSIRAIWVSSNPNNITAKYVRMTVPEFLKKFSKEGIDTRFGKVSKSYVSLDKQAEIKAKSKLFNPRENPSVEQLMSAALKKYPHLDEDELAAILVKNPDYVAKFVWGDRNAARLHSELVAKYGSER